MCTNTICPRCTHLFQSGQTELTGTAVLFARLRLNHEESGAVGIQSGKYTEYPFQIVLTRLIWSTDVNSAPISISGHLTAKSNYGIPFLQPLAICSLYAQFPPNK